MSPKNTVKPNMGAAELAEALSRTLPFVAKDDARPVLGCVKFEAKDGKLRVVSADGFRLAIQTVDYEGEGEALIHRTELKGMTNALKRARRINLSFGTGAQESDTKSLALETELIGYKWLSHAGTFPNYGQLVPTAFSTFGHFDSGEALKALNSLKALADAKAYAIDVTIGNGRLTLANPDDKGESVVAADTESEGHTRLDGKYLAEVLRACGGSVDVKLSNAYSPVVFQTDGYQVVVMPMISAKAEQDRAADVAKAEADKPSQPAAIVAEAEAIAKAEAEGQGPSEAENKPSEQANKPKRSRKQREAVAVTS